MHSHKQKRSIHHFIKKRGKETMDFILIFGGIFVFGMVILNYRIFAYEVQDFLGRNTSSVPTLGVEYVSTEQSLGVREHQAPDSSPFGDSLKAINAVVDTHAALYEHNLKEYLAQKMTTYALAFNTEIPGKRIIIPAIGVDAPIVDAHTKTPEQLEKGDFKDELKMGVVKYPFTSDPGMNGKTLLFGHSSVDGWEYYQQKYGYIFYKLPKLESGDEIIVYRNGHRYTYEVDQTTIARPNKVAAELDKPGNEHALTLMACYPLLSDAKRILVRAKQTNHFDKQLSMK